MASNYPPRKKDDNKSKSKDRKLQQRTASKRYLEATEGVKRNPYGYGETVHGRAVIYKAGKKYNRDWKPSLREDIFGRGAQYKNAKKARSEFEQEAGERRRQRAIGAKARSNRQARFLAAEKKPSKARAGKTKRRER